MRHRFKFAKVALAFSLFMAVTVQAQSTDVAFAGLKNDTTLPVKVTADKLSVNQTDGTAIFHGNVVVTQDTMTLQAPTVTVDYAEDKKSIAKMTAEGGVKMAAGTDAASSQTAEYSPDSGNLVMLGDVLMTQGASVMSGQKLTLNLNTGLGTMDGRVTTTFTPAQTKKK